MKHLQKTIEFKKKKTKAELAKRRKYQKTYLSKPLNRLLHAVRQKAKHEFIKLPEIRPLYQKFYEEYIKENTK